MPAPAKPKKTKQNQPIQFHQVMIPTAPQAPIMPAVASLELSQNQLRAGLYAIWAVVVILIGVAIGLQVRTHTAGVLTTELPVPVAHATIGVVPVPAVPVTGVITNPAFDLNTASPFVTLTATAYQPVDTFDALQPGFPHYTGAIQGTMGTDRVPR